MKKKKLISMVESIGGKYEKEMIEMLINREHSGMIYEQLWGDLFYMNKSLIFKIDIKDHIPMISFPGRSGSGKVRMRPDRPSFFLKKRKGQPENLDNMQKYFFTVIR